MELAEALRDIDCHAPARRLHVRKSDVSRYPGDVGIQRNHQLAGQDFGPDTTVDSVFWPHHPSQKEIDALAGAPLRGAGEKESHADPAFEFPARIELLVSKTQKHLREAVDRLFGIF